MKIALGGDHAGYELKQELIQLLDKEGVETQDFGPFSTASVDYPDFVHPVAKSIAAGDFNFGILICGSANGVAITANKYAGVRAAICWKEELAELARGHNDANILCLPARHLSLDEARAITKKFLSSPFEAGRHAGRVGKIDSCK